MAALASPVELPTSRDSFQHVEAANDIKNPQWIPILQKLESQYDPSQEKELSPYTGASFSSMPTYMEDSPRRATKPASLHSYSRSSVAPETVEHEEASPPPPESVPPVPPIPPRTHRQMNFELPATRPTSQYFERATIQRTSADATMASTDIETMSRSESNAGTSTTTTTTTTDDAASVQAPAVLKEEMPVQAPPPVKEEALSLHQRSTRSSFSSTKKYSIGPPTSKFNRKAVHALPSRITSIQSEANGAANVLSVKDTPAHSRAPTPAASPRLTASLPQPGNVKRPPSRTSNKTPSLRPTPSDASDASHSSADNSPRNPAPTSTEETKEPSHTPRKSSASGRSQKAKSAPKDATPSIPTVMPMEKESGKSLSEKKEPMPVAEKPETVRIEKPETARLAPQPRPLPSSGVSSFMTANDTVIFRRFDEVHVQLLLCMQDEITQLESELMGLESASLTRSDRDTERSRVIRELRKVVSEYGESHLIHRAERCQYNFSHEETDVA
jgi:hypothetical protein